MQLQAITIDGIVIQADQFEVGRHGLTLERKRQSGPGGSGESSESRSGQSGQSGQAGQSEQRVSLRPGRAGAARRSPSSRRRRTSGSSNGSWTSRGALPAGAHRAPTHGITAVRRRRIAVEGRRIQVRAVR